MALAEFDEESILTEFDLDTLYSWIDQVPLSRPKVNISSDFQDAVMVAELIAYHCPNLIQTHNYTIAKTAAQKKINWNTLNRKVLTKYLHLPLTHFVIGKIIAGQPGAIEQFLFDLRKSILASSPAKSSILRSRVRRSGTGGGMNDNGPAYFDMAQIGGFDVETSGSIPEGEEGAGNPSFKQIVVHGNKMIDLKTVMTKMNDNATLKTSIKETEMRIARMETLVRIKDQRIQGTLQNCKELSIDADDDASNNNGTTKSTDDDDDDDDDIGVGAAAATPGKEIVEIKLKSGRKTTKKVFDDGFSSSEAEND